MDSWVLPITRQRNWPKLDFAGGLGRREEFNMDRQDGQDLPKRKRAALMADIEAGIQQIEEGRFSKKSVSDIISRAKGEYSKEKRHGAG